MSFRAGSYSLKKLNRSDNPVPHHGNPYGEMFTEDAGWLVGLPFPYLAKRQCLGGYCAPQLGNNKSPQKK